MKKFRIFVGFMLILLSPFILNPTVWADESCNVVQSISNGPNGPIVKSTPLRKNEVHIEAMRDGVVVGESTLQLDEKDVIIQLKGEPLAKWKGRGISMTAAKANLESARSQVKAEVVRLANEARALKALSPLIARNVVKREYHYVFNGLSARVSSDAIRQIEKLPEVKKVWMDRKVKASLSQSVPLIRADMVWTLLGATGKGIIVAIIDTGIDYTHPDLGGCLGPGCKVIGGYDIVNDLPDPMDDHGHGTHVAGIVAANGDIKGVAPDAKLMAFKVLDEYGTGSFQNVIYGIEQALDPDKNPATDDGADIINLSLGGPGDPNDPVSQAVDNAVDSGVVVVVAAGNAGSDYETIESPGVANKALTVGASDKSDWIAYFSSRGPVPGTYQIKPEVTAPGVAITSSVPSGRCELCNPSRYATLNGTSMATPHVAGTAALLLERYPTWTPQQVKEALMERSISLGLDVFTQGNGRIDAYDSATTSAIGNPGNLSLGLDDLSDPTFGRSQTFTLTNLGDGPLTLEGSPPVRAVQGC